MAATGSELAWRQDWCGAVSGATGFGGNLPAVHQNLVRGSTHSHILVLYLANRAKWAEQNGAEVPPPPHPTYDLYEVGAGGSSACPGMTCTLPGRLGGGVAWLDMQCIPVRSQCGAGRVLCWGPGVGRWPPRPAAAPGTPAAPGSTRAGGSRRAAARWAARGAMHGGRGARHTTPHSCTWAGD